eukprot:XP_001702962.1 predicted protein [Chlamydomonas reinhardtii]
MADCSALPLIPPSRSIITCSRLPVSSYQHTIGGGARVTAFDAALHTCGGGSGGGVSAGASYVHVASAEYSAMKAGHTPHDRAPARPDCPVKASRQARGGVQASQAAGGADRSAVC